MARTTLPPGFRFHPTDEELVMYYLKRKVMGKRFDVEAIAEINICEFSPWDLPDKSCLKTKDLKWFFFCPREKKYSSGVQVRRATENGFWKVTGKDKPVCCDGRTVGMRKTLVFYIGRGPQKERTNWLIYEYRILDDQLAVSGVQDLYVLCKVFQKSGLGPKNGAEYGAPFNEDDWPDHDLDNAQNHVMTFPSGNALGTESVLPDVQSGSAITGMVHLGSTPGLTSTEAGPSVSSDPAYNEVPINDSMDEVHPLPFDERGNHMDDRFDNGKGIALPNSDWNVMYDSSDDFFDDLDFSNLINEGNYDLSARMNYYPLHSIPALDNSSFIELNDLNGPLDCSADPYDQLIAPDILLPGANVEHLSSDGHQTVDPRFYGGYTSTDLNSTNGQPENVGDFTQHLGSGRSYGT